jgi:hypothetical protein
VDLLLIAASLSPCSEPLAKLVQRAAHLLLKQINLPHSGFLANSLRMRYPLDFSNSFAP